MPAWLVEARARRQKWIDQAQSLNLYLANPSGQKLDELYRLAWRRGLKTTYYLRTRSATHVEKSTLRGTDGKLNAVSVGKASGVGEAAPCPSWLPGPLACLNHPDSGCEALPMHCPAFCVARTGSGSTPRREACPGRCAPTGHAARCSSHRPGVELVAIADAPPCIIDDPTCEVCQ